MKVHTAIEEEIFYPEERGDVEGDMNQAPRHGRGTTRRHLSPNQEGDEDLDAMGERMAARKEELMAEMGSRKPN